MKTEGQCGTAKAPSELWATGAHGRQKKLRFEMSRFNVAELSNFVRSDGTSEGIRYRFISTLAVIS